MFDDTEITSEEEEGMDNDNNVFDSLEDFTPD